MVTRLNKHVLSREGTEVHSAHYVLSMNVISSAVFFVTTFQRFVTAPVLWECLNQLACHFRELNCCCLVLNKGNTFFFSIQFLNLLFHKIHRTLGYDLGGDRYFPPRKFPPRTFPPLGIFPPGSFPPQVRLGQFSLGQVSLGQCRFVQVRLGQFSLVQVSLGQFRLGQVKLGQVRLGQFRLVQVSLGQFREPSVSLTLGQLV